MSGILSLWPSREDQRKRQVPCKCCGQHADSYGVVDFSKNCEEVRGLVLPKSEIPIHYYRCSSCGLLFTDDMDHFSEAQFKAFIYNDDYILVDPDLGESRPNKIGNIIENTLGHAKASISILDYGCGTGALIDNLKSRGFTNVTGYDPFFGDFSQKPVDRFDFIICLEVMEHVPNPRHLASDLSSLRKADGIILASTETQPENISEIGLGWWYAAPRNGHITLHTYESLDYLWNDVGLKCMPAGPGVHFALDTVPEFAKDLF